MTKLFDTALPPLWYFVAWLILLVSFILACRIWLVNPLLHALRDFHK
jgi:hypothetical protein